MDISDIVEDDEEAFLKGSTEGFSYMKHGRAFQDEVSTLHEDKAEFPKSVVVDEDEIVASDIDDQSKDYCDDVRRFTKSTSLDSSLDDDFFPLDQQDWENRIIYDNSPDVSETSGGNEEKHGFLSHALHASVEPFGSKKSPESYSSCEETIYHPQLLRLESRVEIDNAVESNTIKRFNKLTLRNNDLLDGTWMDRIVWDPHQSVTKPKLLLDIQDEQMLFEVLDNKDGEHLQLHAGAMITTRSADSAGGDLLEPHCYGGQSGGKFNISNDSYQFVFLI